MYLGDGKFRRRAEARTVAMALKILVVLLILVLAVLGWAATKPDRLHLQRSIVIAAPAEKIFPLLDDFHNWNAWAPGDKDDPTMQRTYSGAACGVGAVSDWRGSGSTGAGRMAITDETPNERVVVTVDFARPFVAHNMNTFTLEQVGPGTLTSPPVTKVTWSFDGSNVYMMRVMSVFVNMDKFMGKHFEDGLANLRAAAEKAESEK
jgi:uncharacterized protein YndB with AHSA1/START domain